MFFLRFYKDAIRNHWFGYVFIGANDMGNNWFCYISVRTTSETNVLLRFYWDDIGKHWFYSISIGATSETISSAAFLQGRHQKPLVLQRSRSHYFGCISIGTTSDAISFAALLYGQHQKLVVLLIYYRVDSRH